MFYGDFMFMHLAAILFLFVHPMMHVFPILQNQRSSLYIIVNIPYLSST